MLGTATQAPKELKLKWNVSYIQGLVLVKDALKSQPIQFERATLDKDSAKLKGNYADGGTVQIVITKISNSESSVTVNLGSSQTAKDEAKRMLEGIAQYVKTAR